MMGDVGEGQKLTRIGDAQYGAPFCDDRGRAMVAVYCDDGERFVTYAVPAALLFG